jgi:hypothetical protein
MAHVRLTEYSQDETIELNFAIAMPKVGFASQSVNKDISISGKFVSVRILLQVFPDLQE